MTRPRLTLATVMMATLTAGVAAALFAQVTPHLVAGKGGVEVPMDHSGLLVLAVVTTAIGLAAWRKHSAFQAMLQMILACLILLSLNGTFELGARWKSDRPLFFWYQVVFALTVVGPLVARRIVRTRVERGPTRNRRVRTCDAVAFSFLNVVLVFSGLWIQILGGLILKNLMKY